MIGRLLLLALAATTALPTQAAEFNFCWRGASGFTMTGVIGFPDALLSQPLITEQDVSHFEIAGYERGVLIGTWSPEGRAGDATWYLRFAPEDLRFLTGGTFPGPQSQGWNANGEANDCGPRGFGFNSGDYSQDFCLNGIWVAHSSIHPATPLVATRQAVTPDCRYRDLTG